jgi:hypothetical protein
LSNDIYKLNEIAKLGNRLEGPQSRPSDYLRPYGYTQFEDKTVAFQRVTTTGLNPAFRININTPVYSRVMFHGGNQYSYATCSHYRQLSPSASELYVLPFQINQTTGAITVGTGSQVILDTVAGTESSTMQWGSAGTHGWFFGYLGRTYVAAWTVSNNVVSGVQSVVVGARDNVGAPLAHSSGNQNHEQSCTRPNGSTSYFAPGARTFNSSAATIGAYDLVYSYNGTTLTKTRENALDATNTNGSQWHGTAPVTPQWSANFEAGTAGATAGWRQFTTTAGATRFQSLNDVLAPVVTVNGNTHMGSPQLHMAENMTGFQLSDGTTLIYDRVGTVTRIGTAAGGYQVTNVTEAARSGNGFPVPQSGRSFVTSITPVAQDTWWVSNVVTPVEYIKIYINPSTLEVQYLDSFNINTNTLTQSRINTAFDVGGIMLTGTDRQFFLTVAPGSRQSCTRAKIRVVQHGRAGR